MLDSAIGGKKDDRGFATAADLKFPSFDHAEGDPVQDDIQILQSHKVIIIEGNYVLLGCLPFNQKAD